MEFTGGCLCGAVRYRLTGPLSDVVVCHCTQCRRQTGHVSADTSVALERLQLERDTTLSWYRSSDRVERGFCRVCGSALFWRRAGDSEIFIGAGSLDGPTGLTISRHIFCKDKGDYYEICDGKPQHPAW